MDADIFLLSVFKTAIVGLGFGVAVHAWRAYRRLQEPTLLYLTLGLAVTTFSAVVEGALFNVFGWPLVRSQTAGAFTMALGLLLLAYSLLVRQSAMKSPAPAAA